MANDMNGYMGSILRVNLSKGTFSTLKTEKYLEWGGGHGIGSKIFFDITVGEKGIDLSTLKGTDPGNVVTLMTSPLSGTCVPGASGRTEVQGIGLQAYPIAWFTRSNFGGRFAGNLKYAGWDGIVIEGKSKKPVWIDIRDGVVEIVDCADLELWGMDTRECQKTIWKYVAGKNDFGQWMYPGDESERQTTQRPAVVAIGQAGEALSRMACLIHDAGNASGQGGFGGVWGAKNLKAISVIGTGGIPVDDPKALIAARIDQQETYAFDPSSKKFSTGVSGFHFAPVPEEMGGLAEAFTKNIDVIMMGGDTSNILKEAKRNEGKRPQSCQGCSAGCRARYEDGVANEASCQATVFYLGCESSETQYKSTDLINRYGFNSYEIEHGLRYLDKLRVADVLGKGKDIPCNLNFDIVGSYKFIKDFFETICNGDDSFSKAVREGFVRAAETWGRLDQDLESGILAFPYWGFPEHSYDPRAELEWGYGSILGDRDINEHCFNSLFWEALHAGGDPETPAEETVDIYTSKMIPYNKDSDRMSMLDFSDANMYSKSMAKLVVWHRHYTRYFKQSLLFCDHRWPDFFNKQRPDKKGSTPKAEPTFLNAVVGGESTFADGMEVGRKIWNLDHAIWTLQGRDRGMVKFAPYIYNIPYPGYMGDKVPGMGFDKFQTYYMPGKDGDTWTYLNLANRTLDEDGFERLKDEFYKLEGWDPKTGYPKRSTLEDLGLDDVVEELKKRDRLGEE